MYGLDGQFLASKQADVSILRILSTVAIIWLHTNNTLLSNPQTFELDSFQQLILTCNYTASGFAVPMFWMITGILLLKREKNITWCDCVFKYSKRMALALLVFGVPFSMMELYLDTRTLNLQMLGKAFYNVLIGQSWGHLWYLYALIGVYLALPVLKSWTDNASRKDMRYILVILFVFTMIVPLLNCVLNNEIAFEFPMSSRYVFYLLLGKYLSDYCKIGNRKRGIIGILLMMICLLTLTYIAAGNSLYESIVPIFVMLWVGIIYLTFKDITLEQYGDVLWKIDRLCFGVYLIHPLFINFVYKFLKVTPVSFDLFWLAIPAFWLLFVLCSFVASWIMSKIPLLRKNVL